MATRLPALGRSRAILAAAIIRLWVTAFYKTTPRGSKTRGSVEMRFLTIPLGTYTRLLGELRFLITLRAPKIRPSARKRSEPTQPAVLTSPQGTWRSRVTPLALPIRLWESAPCETAPRAVLTRSWAHLLAPMSLRPIML